MVGGARSETKDKRVTQSHTISSIINTSGTPGGGGGGNHLSSKTQIQKYKKQKYLNPKHKYKKYSLNAKHKCKNTKYKKYSLNAKHKIPKIQPQSIIHRENAEDGVEIIEAHNT